MTKNLIKGGLHLSDDSISLNTKQHSLDETTNKLLFIKGNVETNNSDKAKGDSLYAQKNYTLYKFFDIKNYKGNKFNLPADIEENDVHKIYLFGVNEKNSNYFVKKNNKVNNFDFSKHYNNIGKALNILYSNGGNVKIILLAHYIESKELYIIFYMNKQDDIINKFNSLKMSFFTTLFINYDNNEYLKKNFKISHLKDLINFTETKMVKSSGTSTRGSGGHGGYNKKLKRKELNTMSLNELKQLHRNNGIKMNGNKTFNALINNYIKNYK